MAILTDHTGVAIARGTAWSADLRQEFGSGGITGQASIRNRGFVGQRNQATVASQRSQTLTLAGVSEGPKIDMLRSHQFDRQQPDALVWADGEAAFYFEAEVGEIPMDADPTDVLLVGLSFPRRGAWYEAFGAVSATEFAFADGANTISLGGTVQAGKKLVLFVAQYNGATSHAFRLAGADISVSGSGMYLPDSPSANQANANLTNNDALTGAQTISGVVAVLDKWE